MARPVTVLVTRPQPDADALAARLRADGYRAIAAPATAIERIALATSDDLAGADGVVFTSANAVRAVAEDGLGAAETEPVYCVGDRTASAAREAGWAEVRSAGGDATDLAAMIAELRPKPQRLTHFRGEVAATDLGAELPGVELRERVLYRARPARALPADAAAALAAGEVDVALFLSAEAAKAFAQLVDPRWPQIPIAVHLSPRVAAAAPSALASEVRIAQRPDLDAALAELPASTGC